MHLQLVGGIKLIKSKRTILMIGVVLAALLAGAIACTVSLYRHSETLTSTIETLQRENDTMEQQLLGSTGETPEQPEETTSAPTLTAEPSKAEQAAMDAVMQTISGFVLYGITLIAVIVSAFFSVKKDSAA